MRSSSSFSSICPWATVKLICGHSARSRTAVSSMSSTRLCRKNAWPLARLLALQRLLDELLVVLADVGLDGPAALRRRLDHADVAQAGERHLQRARDRRRAHRDDVDLELHLAQQLLLLDAEALLLVDDQQPEVLRAHVAREQPVGADQDVDLALGEALDGLALLGGGAEARDVLDRERVVAQALGERAEVLLGEDRRRHQHQHLLAGVGRLERGAQRDLGLAVADVAADQPVHRALGLHVLLDRLDRLALVGRLAVREVLLELAQPVRVGLERVAAAALALRVEVEQLARELLRGAAGARLELVPARAAELGQRRVRAVGADVARDLRELVDRQEDLVGARVLEVEVVARDAGDGLGVEAGEARDPVVLVDDDVARAQVGERAQQAAAAARAALGRARSRLRRWISRCSGTTASLSCGRDEAVAQRRLDEDELVALLEATPWRARGCRRRARRRRAAAR